MTPFFCRIGGGEGARCAERVFIKNGSENTKDGNVEKKKGKEKRKVRRRKTIVFVSGNRGAEDAFDLSRKATGVKWEWCFVATGKRLVKAQRTSRPLAPRAIPSAGKESDLHFEVPFNTFRQRGGRLAEPMEKAIAGFRDVYRLVSPALLLLPEIGREYLAAALAASTENIPIVLRHPLAVPTNETPRSIYDALSKMAHYHLLPNAGAAERLRDLPKKRTAFVGAWELDPLTELKYLTRNQLEKRLGKSLGKRPLFIDVMGSGRRFEEMLRLVFAVLEEYTDSFLFLVKPVFNDRTAAGIKLMESFSLLHPQRSALVPFWDQELVYSAMKHSEAWIGNHRRGFFVTPYFHLPAVFLGKDDSYSDWESAASVLLVEPEKKEFSAAMKKILATRFRNSCKKVKSPYGNGQAVKKTVTALSRWIKE